MSDLTADPADSAARKEALDAARRELLELEALAASSHAGQPQAKVSPPSADAAGNTPASSPAVAVSVEEAAAQLVAAQNDADAFVAAVSDFVVDDPKTLRAALLLLEASGARPALRDGKPVLLRGDEEIPIDVAGLQALDIPATLLRPIGASGSGGRPVHEILGVETDASLLARAAADHSVYRTRRADVLAALKRSKGNQ